MNTTKAELVTRKHMQRVASLLMGAAKELLNRADDHDVSKLLAVELEPLQRMQDLIDKEGQATYGSDEYRRRTSMLGEMTKHHYANNSHHPEHYQDGISGMDLFDVLEMVLDWKAASERGEERVVNVTASVKRFDISPQLESIIKNTFMRAGWKIS